MSQTFCNILLTRHNSAALNAFAKVVKMINYSGLRVRLVRFTYMAWSTALGSMVLKATWPCLIIEVLTKIKISWIIWLLYCNQQHLLQNKCFGCFCSIMVSFQIKLWWNFHLCHVQITHWVKQCTLGQSTIYQPQWLYSMVWTALVLRYMCLKLAFSKISFYPSKYLIIIITLYFRCSIAIILLNLKNNNHLFAQL